MAMDAESNDIALMMRVREGDTHAFETLHGRYQRRVLGYFYGLSRDAADANELCQETFVRVWTVRRRYRATGAFPAYLFGIARMVWLERGRSVARRAQLVPLAASGAAAGFTPGPLPWPDAAARVDEVERHIFEALDALPAEQREVVVLRHIRGLSLDEIAAALDCPVNTVRSRRALAIKKLRCALAPLLDAAGAAHGGE